MSCQELGIERTLQSSEVFQELCLIVLSYIIWASNIYTVIVAQHLIQSGILEKLCPLVETSNTKYCTCSNMNLMKNDIYQVNHKTLRI